MQAAIVEDIQGGLGQDDAAARNGIHRNTLARWIKENEAFQGAIEKARAQFEHDNLLIIRQAALAMTSRDGNTLLRRGSWQAAAWILERRMPDKYGQKWQGELSGKGGKPLIPEGGPRVDVSRFTDAQLDKLIVATDLMLKAPKSESATNGNGSQPHGDH